jgi:hypothetical protein
MVGGLALVTLLRLLQLPHTKSSRHATTTMANHRMGTVANRTRRQPAVAALRKVAEG